MAASDTRARVVAELASVKAGKAYSKLPVLGPIVSALEHLLGVEPPAPEPAAVVLSRNIPVEAPPALVAQVLSELASAEETAPLLAPAFEVTAVGPTPPAFAADAPLRPSTAQRMEALRESERQCRKRLRRRTGEAATEIVQRVRRIAENSSPDTLGMNAPTPPADPIEGYAHTRRTVSFVRAPREAPEADAADRTPVVVNLYM